MGNWTDNLSASTSKVVFLVLTLLVLGWVIYRVLDERRTYGTLSFLGRTPKILGVVAVAALALQAVQLSKPYVAPPTGQLAVVLGNTQNSPAPKIDGDVSTMLEQTMLLHRGEEVGDLTTSMAFVSATGNPEVISLQDDALDLVGISMNKTRAERDVNKNVEALQNYFETLLPEDNGANYLEAILIASQNVDPQSNILVIGSGLSDAGDLDFAHDNLLTDEDSRAEAIDALQEKYGPTYLGGANVYFAGLGDTTEPQYPLTSKQKDIVRGVYEEAIRAIGGRPHLDSTTQVGESVNTDFVVDATDTECGPLDRTFTEDSIQFVSDMATYVEPSKASDALKGLVEIYNSHPDAVTSINIGGFIANESGAPKVNAFGLKLSEDRATTVLESLVGLGIPRTKLTAAGKGFGPHADPERPELDRMVKVTVNRDNPDC